MKRSNASTSIRRLSSALLLVGGQRLAELAGLDLLAQPHALAVAGDVLDLVGDRAAVGLAQVRQRVGERRARARTCAGSCAGIRRHELGREAERLGVERRVALGLGAERVEPRGEVAVGAVGLERATSRPGRPAAAPRRRAPARSAPARPRRRAAAAAAAAGAGGCGRRAELDAERREDALVEAVLALEVGLDGLEEAPRLRALDDPVVVGRGHRHDLLGADHVADVPEADRVGDRAGGDDRALADHEPRDRGDRADAARVGERDVRAGEVVGGELVLARLGDEVVEGGLEVARRSGGRRRG